MSCTPAPSCRAALDEATVLFPARHKGSDGICASPQHTQQNPTSDHETGDAWDLTHDPANGCDVDALFDRIVKRRDPRVKYLIRNKRILRSYDKPGIPAWTWAPYTGPNPHTKHGHCSILPGVRHNVTPWFDPAPTPPPTIPPEDTHMATVAATHDPTEPGQALEFGGHSYVLDGESASELAKDGVKTVHVSKAVLTQILDDAK